MTITVFDFFSGCGGTSAGFERAGMKIGLGVDCDEDAERSFRKNFPRTPFVRKDIRKIRPSEIAPHVEKCRTKILFSGCAPCQPFSSQRGSKARRSTDKDLLDEFGRLVKAFRPHFVFCENVSGLQRVGHRGPFGRFRTLLTKLGYSYTFEVVASQAYGVPQLRRRLILVASLEGEPELPPPTHGPEAGRPYATVGDWIRGLPRLKAGETHAKDPVHRAAALSALNLKRIRATPPGGSRLDWPKSLRLRCHTRRDSFGHTDVYGRMRVDAPAAAMTTRCISLSNGRFGHPTQHRAISLREAACLQTFPRDFKFHGSFVSMARQIGNAVPVLLAQRVGEQLISLAGADR